MLTNTPKRPKILLVDDDPSQAMLLHSALREVGDMSFETDGPAAIHHVLSNRPDVVLLDIELPGMNGYEVLQQLKATPSTHHIPVIFITAHGSTQEQLRCLQEGAVDFIPKPLEAEVVAARVRTQLQLRQRERALVEIYRHAQVTLECIGDAVITTDERGDVTYMNPVAEVLTCLPLHKARGLPIEEVMPLRFGDDGPPHVNPVKTAIRERRVVGMALNCQMLTHTGRWIAVEDSAAPLVSEGDEVIGAVIVFHESDAARSLAVKLAQNIQKDQLTNLPNRLLLLDRIRNEIEHGAHPEPKMGLFVLDINHFKYINEAFGFEFGDDVLKTVASLIQSQLKNGEMLSRNNADEFMIFVPHAAQTSDLTNLAIALREQLALFAKDHPNLSDFSVAIGVSVYPDDAHDAQSLLMHADAALHRAKTDPGTEGVCFFSTALESKFVDRRRIFAVLKNAVAQDAVQVLYQPLVDAYTGKVMAVEALMRLKWSDGRTMAPCDFIPLAEESKLIVPLGQQMIRQVLQQARAWDQASRPLRVCINISAVQFMDPHFWPFLLRTIRECQTNPHSIELEVTESLMIDNLTQVSQDLAAMRAMGITVAIDDFGTGYSCLSYLRDLPVDVLKIDKSFVSRLTSESPDDALVKTITQLAQILDLHTVAEGVETVFQAKRLRELGVHLLQGYLFSQPVPAAELLGLYTVPH